MSIEKTTVELSRERHAQLEECKYELFGSENVSFDETVRALIARSDVDVEVDG